MKILTQLLIIVCISINLYGQTKNDRVYINVNEITSFNQSALKFGALPPENSDSQKMGLLVRGALIGSGFVDPVVNIASNQISKLIENRSKKFIGIYKSKLMDDNFFRIVGNDSAIVNIDNFEIIRENNQIINSIIKLKPIISEDQNYFRLEVVYVKVNKGRSSRIKKSLDIDLKITFIYKDNDFSDVSYETPSVLLEGLAVGEEFTNLKNVSTSWMKLPLPTIINKKSYNSIYELDVEVTETDNYKKRADKIKDNYSANKDDLKTILKELLK